MSHVVHVSTSSQLPWPRTTYVWVITLVPVAQRLQGLSGSENNTSLTLRTRTGCIDWLTTTNFRGYLLYKRIRVVCLRAFFKMVLCVTASRAVAQHGV